MPISYVLSEKLTKILKAVDLRAAESVQLLAGLHTESREAIQRQVRISTIGATTRIENAVLTDAQIDWIDTELVRDGRPTAFAARRADIQNKLSKDRERSLEEVAGCREMLAIAYAQGADLFPLTQATLRGLHQELLKYYEPAAFHIGKYKVVPNSVIERNAATGEERIILQTSNPGPITEAAVAELLEWYNANIREHPWPVAVACELVFRFLASHPFQDGNGRLGRALFTMALLHSDDANLRQLAPYLAVDRFIEQNRVEYYAVLTRVSNGRFDPNPTAYDLPAFLLFMLKAMDHALDSIALYKNRVELIRGLSASATVVLDCFKEQPESKLAPKQIRERTKLPERTISRVLGEMVDTELLQRYGRGRATRYQLVF